MDRSVGMAGLASGLDSQRLAAMECPRTYLYKLREKFTEISLGAGLQSEASVDRAFGQVDRDRSAGQAYELRSTSMYALAQIMVSKLMRSHRCRTYNASRADVFVVPALIAPKHQGSWARACGRFTEAELVAALPHLNERTARRHLLLVSKGHYSAAPCAWWSSPRSLLSQAVRVAYSPGIGADGLFLDQVCRLT